MLFSELKDFELRREMYYPLLIALIYLTGAICASNNADGLDQNQRETHLQRRQELAQSRILLNVACLL